MSSSEPRLTGPTLKVLKLFLENPREAYAGAQITRLTKVGPGTLYPMLLRLEAHGWLTSEWELLDPSEAGRPRQRFYRISAMGQNKAREAFAAFQLEGGLSWAR